MAPGCQKQTSPTHPTRNSGDSLTYLDFLIYFAVRFTFILNSIFNFLSKSPLLDYPSQPQLALCHPPPEWFFHSHSATLPISTRSFQQDWNSLPPTWCSPCHPKKTEPVHPSVSSPSPSIQDQDSLKTEMIICTSLLTDASSADYSPCSDTSTTSSPWVDPPSPTYYPCLPPFHSSTTTSPWTTPATCSWECCATFSLHGMEIHTFTMSDLLGQRTSSYTKTLHPQ